MMADARPAKRSVWTTRPKTPREGFTLIELLIVVALIAILGTISAALFTQWRSQAVFDEVAAQVQQAISLAREEAKRQTADVEMVFVTDATSFDVVGTDGAGDVVIDRTFELPSSATLASTVTLEFSAIYGELTPYAPQLVQLRSSAGALGREGVISILPPFGILGVTR